MSLDGADHDPYIRRCIGMAETAAERGDRPCGSLLVRDGEVLHEDTNRVYTDDDLALHPELSLARWADRELAPEERAEAVVYTTIEPCSMCATGIALAGLGGVVFCVSGAEYWDLVADSGLDVPTGYIPCAEVLDRLGRDVPVVESVLEEEGLVAIREHVTY